MNVRNMTFNETAFTFTGKTPAELTGIIHCPQQTAGDVGLLVVVGGPQYRIGAHRQYVHLARHCAACGIPAMRFDYQGIGDSDGDYPGFEHVNPDIDAAIDELLRRVPEIKSVAIWGLCEGASAILLGAAEHKAVSHIILANPWVRTDSGLAKAYVKHYYIDRLRHPDFWKKMFSGRLDIMAAIRGLVRNIKQAVQPATTAAPAATQADGRPFPARMLSGLAAYQGRALLIQSAQDLVAREFDDLITSDRAWRRVVRDKITTRIDIPDTDHTFSTEKWRRNVAEATANWLLSGK